MKLLAKLLPLVVVVLLAPGALAAPVPKDAKDGNPLPARTVWKGKLTQKGGGPDEYDCVFTITKRDGEKFEATLYEKTPTLELTYLIRGTVELADPKNRDKGFKIEFTSYEAKDVKNTSEIVGVPYTGKLDGKKMKGSWKLPPDSPFGELEGDFEFDLSEKMADNKKKD